MKCAKFKKRVDITIKILYIHVGDIPPQEKLLSKKNFNSALAQKGMV